MPYFRNSEDRIPVLIITSLFLLDLVVYASVDHLVGLAFWATFAFGMKLFISAWNHHHQHCKTFHQTWLNRLLEIVYTFHTGITTNVWVLHHNLGHHLNYLDQEKDESRWMRRSGTTMGFFEYTFATAITGYYRSFSVGKKYPKYRTDLIAMGVINMTILGILVTLRPIPALLVFVLPMVLAYLGTCATTYFHHAGLEATSHEEASHNVLNNFYNRITGNLGYHTAHHMKQGLHWSKLPEFHQRIENQIPEHLISYDFPGFAWLKHLKSAKNNSTHG